MQRNISHNNKTKKYKSKLHIISDQFQLKHLSYCQCRYCRHLKNLKFFQSENSVEECRVNDILFFCFVFFVKFDLEFMSLNHQGIAAVIGNDQFRKYSSTTKHSNMEGYSTIY